MALLERITPSARYLLDELATRWIIKDFREYCSEPPKRRALVSYLVAPLWPPRRLRDRTRFSNRGIAQEIPRALNELGFAVDIIDCRNETFFPRTKYDLFIGHAGINFEKLARRMQPDVPSIYFASGIEWRECNRHQELRMHEVRSRRSGLFESRMVVHSEESARYLADAVICLGSRAARTYAGYPKVLTVDNATYPVNWNGWQQKDYSKGRSRFLFFAGPGNILKGLDLVLEAFAGTHLELYLCQRIEPEFARAFHRELFESANIHLEGFVKMRSPRFFQLATMCDWIILPTCADAQPGSVIECMGHGLLPILPDSANIDLPFGGIRIERLEVESVRAAADAAGNGDPAHIEAAARALIREVRSKYSPENFREGFKRAVSDVLAERRKAHEDRMAALN